MKRLLLSSAVAAVPFAFATSAHADCDTVTPGSNSSATCDSLSINDGPDAVETRSISSTGTNIRVSSFGPAQIDTTASGNVAITLHGADNEVRAGGFVRSASDGIVIGDEAEVSVTTGAQLVTGGDGIVGETDQFVVDEAQNDFERTSSTNLSVRVRVGGRIDAAGDAVRAGDGLTVNNEGFMDAEDDLVQGRTLRQVFNADGSPKQDQDFQDLYAEDGADNVTVTNTGFMRADGKGISVGDGLLLDNAGVLESRKDDAVAAGKNAVIENDVDGTIQGFGNAIQAGGNTRLTNDGLIEKTQQAYQVTPNSSVQAQDAVTLESGTIINNGTIRGTVGAAIDFGPGAQASIVVNSSTGVIEGTVGISTDDADTQSQSIANVGVLRGTSGLALDLGQGNDRFEMIGGTLDGGADFGAGQDVAVFNAAYSFTTDFAAGELFDGGLDIDTILFDNMDFSALDVLWANADELRLNIGGGADLHLKSWEFFVFSDQSEYSFDALASLAPSQVPLPANMLLLGSALVGFGTMARRRKRA